MQRAYKKSTQKRVTITIKTTTTMKATTTMAYSTGMINKNFKIKVYGVDNNGQRINKLVGVSGLITLIGIEFVNKFVTRAMNEGADATYCKLRRGLKVTLYAR